MMRMFGGGGGLPPGVAGNGLVPGGLTVAGAIVAGDSDAAAWADDLVYGSLSVNDTPGSVAADHRLVYVHQGVPLPADSYIPALHVSRTADTAGHVFQEPVALLYNSTLTASDIILQLEANVAAGPSGYDDHIAMRVNSVGGLGLFGHPPPTTARTLAQATITAITDANAKAAVQALANALSDMGVLTLT